MKLKHVLFSSLFLSAGLVACTNDEFAEIQTPSANVENGISLGEGFTISGAKLADTPATKAYFEVNGGLNAYWQETDIVGAAWYNMVEEIDEETGLVTKSNDVNTSHEYFSNTDFKFLEFIGGDKGNARFEANTNVMAGAYVMYYPWDKKVAQVSEEIPVKREFPCTVDLTEGKEFDNVSERMFSYGVAAFVPGGRQTRHFELNQVPVIYRLHFGAEHLNLVNLEKDPLVIDRIIFEAYDASGESVLTTAGSVKPRQLTTDDYNEYLEWIQEGENTTNPLPAAKYEGDKNSAVGHYTILLNNSDQAAYRIDALDEPGLTDGAIVFSALPFLKPASKVVVKIITNTGINLQKVYENAADLKDFNEGINGNGATSEGGFVMKDIYVDSQTNDLTIYTKDQFLAQWNKAIENQEKAELTIADPVILDDVILATEDMNGAKITINTKDNATLTVKGINLEGSGSLTIKSDVTVLGDILSGSNQKLVITGELVANNIRVQGKAELKVKEMASLLIEDSGEMTLETVGNNAKNIGKITVMGNGQLTASGYLGEISNDGTLSVSSGKKLYNTGTYTGSVDATAGEFVNNGTFNGAVEGTFTNNGTYTGEVATYSTFTNAEDAKATFKATANKSNVTLKNDGTVTISNANATTTYSLKSGSENNGTIEVESGKLSGTWANNGTVNVYGTSQVDAKNVTIANDAWIVVKSMNAKVTNYTTLNSNGRTAFSAQTAEDVEDYNKGTLGAAWLWIDKAMELPTTSLTADVQINANVTMAGDISVNGYVNIEKNVRISTKNNIEHTFTVNPMWWISGKLTLTDYVTLKGAISKDDYRNISGGKVGDMNLQ